MAAIVGERLEVAIEMTRQSRVLAASIVAAAQVAPARAQQPYPSPPPAPVDPRPTLELSLQDAVARALENNADIAVERFNPQASAENVRAAQGAYDPFVSGSIGYTNATQPAQNIFSGGLAPESKTTAWSLAATQLLPTGGDLSLRFDNNRTSTTSLNPVFNPSFDSNLTISASQPLLRNLKIDSARQQLRVSKRNREISETNFRQSVLNTIAGVKQLYYDLIYSIDNLGAQRKSLELAKKFLDENQIKVRVGTMAPLDVVEAEAEVALREENVILAEAAVYNAEDAIKRSIAPKNDPVIWGQRIVPSDRPTAEPFTVDTDAAIKNALEKRMDILVARLSLENAETTLQFARSQFLPQVDAFVSYGAAGLGGTQLRDPVTRELLPQPLVGGFGDALSALFGRDFPTWTVGVNFSVPIRNRQAAAGRAQAQISVEQANANLRRLELSVVQEVRNAARAVETNFKRTQTNRSSRILQERRLDAQEKRFAAGMSTNFLVTQAQRDLAFAEVAELQAIADYRKSLVEFERVQEGSGGVSFGSSSTSSVRNVPGIR
jgi:outer membrane protein TolC